MDMIKKQVEEISKNQNHILKAIKYLDEKIKEVIDNGKNTDEIKNIIESQDRIDGIIVKNSDDILAMEKTKAENADAIKVLESKIDMINHEIESIKSKDKNTKKERQRKDKFNTPIKCKLCDKHFERFVDLEKHVKENHDNREEFQCDQCDKKFVIKWRLEKHMTMHTKDFVQSCHYFNNGKMCPFEELGCKFLHVFASNCKFGHRCNKRLCPRRHDNGKDDTINDTEKEFDEEQFSKNDADSMTVDDSDSFVTSTPQKTKFQCEECENILQCTDCFVRQTLETSSTALYKKKVHFKDISRERY